MLKITLFSYFFKIFKGGWNKKISLIFIIIHPSMDHHLNIGPGGLRAQPGVADGSKAGHCSHLLFLLFGPGVLACATRDGGRSEAGHCFHLLFFLFFFYAFCFSPTSGNSGSYFFFLALIYWHN